MTSQLKVDSISPATGSEVIIGQSGGTVKLAGGATAVGFGGGKVLQVVSSTKTAAQSIATTAWTAILDLYVSITPSSTSSKILIIASVSAYRFGGIRLYRNGSSLGITSAVSDDNTPSLLYLDSPATTSSTTYQVYGRHHSSGYPFTINSNNSSYGGMASTITAIEVAA